MCHQVQGQKRRIIEQLELWIKNQISPIPQPVLGKTAAHTGGHCQNTASYKLIFKIISLSISTTLTGSCSHPESHRKPCWISCLCTRCTWPRRKSDDERLGSSSSDRSVSRIHFSQETGLGEGRKLQGEVLTPRLGCRDMDLGGRPATTEQRPRGEDKGSCPPRLVLIPQKTCPHFPVGGTRDIAGHSTSLSVTRSRSWDVEARISFMWTCPRPQNLQQMETKEELKQRIGNCLPGPGVPCREDRRVLAGPPGHSSETSAHHQVPQMEELH